MGLDIFNLGGGIPWVVTTSGILPDDTGIQWDISKFGGTQPALSFLYNNSDLTSRSTYAFSEFDFGIYNFMEDSLIIYRRVWMGYNDK